MKLLIFLLLFNFVTPTPQNVELLYMMSSEWSQWSPWSFCSNNVRVRVRACSTVKGFKCIGHNKEFETCDNRKPTESPKEIDYDGFDDPYSEDRKLAMSQLYEDYENGVAHSKIKTPFSMRKAYQTRPPIYKKKNILDEMNGFKKPFVKLNGQNSMSQMSTMSPKIIKTIMETQSIAPSRVYPTTTKITQTTTTTMATTPQSTPPITHPKLQPVDIKEESNMKPLTLDEKLALLKEKKGSGTQLRFSPTRLPNYQRNFDYEETGTQEMITKDTHHSGEIRKPIVEYSMEEDEYGPVQIPAASRSEKKTARFYVNPPIRPMTTRRMTTAKTTTTTTTTSPTTKQYEEIETNDPNEQMPVMTSDDLMELDRRIASIDERDDSIPRLMPTRSPVMPKNKPQRQQFKNGAHFYQSSYQPVSQYRRPALPQPAIFDFSQVEAEKRERLRNRKTKMDKDNLVLSETGTRSINQTIDKIGTIIEKMESDARKLENPLEIPDLERMNAKERRIYKETRTLEEKLKLVEKQMHKTTNDIRQKALDEGQAPFIEGDTARALSWMIANMTRELEGHELPIVDIIPLEKVTESLDETKTNKISGEAKGKEEITQKIASDTVNVEFVDPNRSKEAPIYNKAPTVFHQPLFKAFSSKISQDGPIDLDLIEMTANKLERLVNEDTKLVNKWPLDTSNKRKPSVIIKWKWSRWSEWSECDCGVQKRKRVCIAKRSRKLSDVFDENGQRKR
ncbi:unnamed protein product, partial [Mesorhabditis belari]|uniref:Uncharacterized protein n=1 Tax=Mesorhabditis belari TaxID=2138241 RepID=A0AAF3EIU1_9BILA